MRRKLFAVLNGECETPTTRVLAADAICERTGLGDASTFYRVFREEAGLSPAAYRDRFGRMSA